jgi:hypothetical protein
LPFVLYGYETWSLALRDEHKLRVFENRMLRRIFGPRGDEVIGGWRKLHNEELHNLYSPPSVIRMVKSRRMEFGSVIYCFLRRPEMKLESDECRPGLANTKHLFGGVTRPFTISLNSEFNNDIMS